MFEPGFSIKITGKEGEYLQVADLYGKYKAQMHESLIAGNQFEVNYNYFKAGESFFKSLFKKDIEAEADRISTEQYNLFYPDIPPASLQEPVPMCTREGYLLSNSQIRPDIFLKGVKFTHIKGGTFLMGSPESEPERIYNETQRSVTLSGFYLSEKTITYEQYYAFLNDSNIPPHGKGIVQGFGKRMLIPPGSSYHKGSWEVCCLKANHPVTNITWYGAKAYCDWAGCRLPSEAEWEYACRAGTETPFHTGNNLTTEQANYQGRFPYIENEKNVYGYGAFLNRSQPVGCYPPNAWGLYDMHGNVWEWCSDLIGEDTHHNRHATDLEDEVVESYRVLRGGCWRASAGRCRSAARFITGDEWRRIDFGFRIAASL